MKHRIAYIDILKGILIILVVLGHLPQCSDKLHQWIFWFHMPAFFMVAGFFVKDNISLKDEISSKFKRLIVPYLFFSLVLGTIARNGSIFKQITGTLIGANGNITAYTFPYYFLTVLFWAHIVLHLIEVTKRPWKKYLCIIFLYLLSHSLANLFPNRDLGWIPWNLDMSLFVAAYLCIGNKLIDYQLHYKMWGNACIILAIIMSALWEGGVWDYSFNLKAHNWFLGLDIIIPFIFTMAFLVVSQKLEKIMYVCRILSHIGMASLSILLLHPLFICINKELLGANCNVFMALFINIAECLVIHTILAYFNFTRFLLGLPNKK